MCSGKEKSVIEIPSMNEINNNRFTCTIKVILKSIIIKLMQKKVQISSRNFFKTVFL